MSKKKKRLKPPTRSTRNVSGAEARALAHAAINDCHAGYIFTATLDDVLVEHSPVGVNVHIEEIGYPGQAWIYDTILLRAFQDVRMKIREKLACGAYGEQTELVRRLIGEPELAAQQQPNPTVN